MVHEGRVRKIVDILVDKLYAEGLFRNCTECFEWNIDKEICKKFNQRPPASVIVKGCEHFDEIPF